MYALVDCNSCYASCEQIFRPDLRGKPVVVLSNNDGCIIARSKEAKALGIPDLQPFFKIKGLLKTHNVNIFSSNYQLYGDISQRVMNTLGDFAPDIEVYSIDEMFLSLDGIQGDLRDYGQAIKSRLWKDVRMPVGIAPTKTLAKLANHAAKKIPKTQGVCLLDTPVKWRWLQKRLAVNKVWGVGSRLSRRLKEQGIETVLDLANADAKHIRHLFSVNLERTIEELNGTPCIPLEDQPPPKKQIFCTRSFGEKPSTLPVLQNAVCSYATRAAEKLRAQGYFANCIQVFINTSPFEPNYYSRGITVKFPYATDDSRLICSVARKAVEDIFRENKRYLKAGVGLLDLTDKSFCQQDMFTKGQGARSDHLMAVLDKVNGRYGQGALYLASEGSKERWSMRQQYRSPCYTTSWQDVPRVTCS